MPLVYLGTGWFIGIALVAPPDERDTYIHLRVNADRLTTPDRSSRPIEGVVLVRPSRPAEFRYGDRVRVTGE